MTDRKSVRFKGKRNWTKNWEHVPREGRVAPLAAPGIGVRQS